ncbi:MAG: PHP domain-containing protein [Deltaproteobacteria bacterium]|nr:PHP domain-containing protein [Deltaproteobacteria bacterium]
MKFDLHVHSSFSPCGHMDLDTIFQAARHRGLEGLCLTDHHSREAARHLTPGRQAGGLVVLVGEEYSTPQGDFLVLGPEISPRPGLAAAELLAWVEARGGVAVAAHPCRRGRSVDPAVLTSPEFLLMEAHNGRNRTGEDRRARELAVRLGLATVAGSDAHTPEELGRVFTRLSQPVTRMSELVALLRTMAAWAAPRAAGARSSLPLVPGPELSAC